MASLTFMIIYCLFDLDIQLSYSSLRGHTFNVFDGQREYRFVPYQSLWPFRFKSDLWAVLIIVFLPNMFFAQQHGGSPGRSSNCSFYRSTCWSLYSGRGVNLCFYFFSFLFLLLSHCQFKSSWTSLCQLIYRIYNSLFSFSIINSLF